MVEAQTKNQNIFWLWSNKVDWEKRGDVSYWLPQYDEVAEILNKTNSRPLADLSEIITKGETPRTKGDVYVEAGVPFIRVTNISEEGIKTDDLVKISQYTHSRLKRSTIKPNDIVFSMAGTIGVATVIPDEINEANINQAVTKIRLKKEINPVYVSTFLNSKYGRLQSLRFAGGGVQKNIDFHEIKRIRIFLPTPQEQRRVEEIVKEALLLKKEAEQEYQEAIILLETTLKFSDSNQRVFTRWSNEIDLVERLDVGYWQQPTIKVSGTKLSEVASVNTGKQYAVYENAKSEVEFISIKDFENLYVGEADRFVLQDDVIEKTKITRGDVLLAVTGATIGKVGIFNRPEAVVSADVAIIRTKTLNPNFLGALIQSKYGKSLVDKYTYGATNKHLDIRGFSENFVIPKIDKKIMNKIGKLLDSSIKHKGESKQKLQEAKKIVEELITK